MSKLFQLKEYLSVPETAKHLSIVFGEDVTEADVFRLASDNGLRLSLCFPRGVMAMQIKESLFNEAKKAADFNYSDFLKAAPKWTRKSLTEHFFRASLSSELLSESDKYERIREISYWKCGIVLTACSQNEYEKHYQELTFKATVEDYCGDDCLIVKGCYDHFQVLSVPPVLLPKTGDPVTCEMLGISHAKNFPPGSYLLVNTEDIREFEQSLTEPSAVDENPVAGNSRDHVSDNLATLNQTAAKFWGNADRTDRSTHPKKNDVVAWLVAHGFSQITAESGATIIRPPWAATGRKAEE